MLLPLFFQHHFLLLFLLHPTTSYTTKCITLPVHTSDTAPAVSRTQPRKPAKRWGQRQAWTKPTSRGAQGRMGHFSLSQRVVPLAPEDGVGGPGWGSLKPINELRILTALSVHNCCLVFCLFLKCHSIVFQSAFFLYSVSLAPFCFPQSLDNFVSNLLLQS